MAPIYNTLGKTLRDLGYNSEFKIDCVLAVFNFIASAL